MRINGWQALGIVAALAVAAPACSKKKEEKPAEQSTTTTTAGTSSTKATPGTTKVPTTGTTIAAKGGTSQWASSATATTSWGANPGDAWNASQAIGEPNVPTDEGDHGCGDITQAWASKEHTTVDTLTLGYQSAVIPTAINIYETYNPGAVVKVVVSGPGSKSKTVYEAQPVVVTECPRVLEVPVSGVDFAVDTVAITVDQSQAQSWAEIDAVQLVGNKPA